MTGNWPSMAGRRAFGIEACWSRRWADRARNLLMVVSISTCRQLAAAYAFGLARNHPFVDGNKRTAAVACELFLELNGYLLVAADEDLYPVFAALAAGDLPRTSLPNGCAVMPGRNKSASRLEAIAETRISWILLAATPERLAVADFGSQVMLSLTILYRKSSSASHRPFHQTPQGKAKQGSGAL